MDRDMIWLSTSLFCNKRQWGNLLLNAIETFILVEKNNTLKGYTIEVNYLSGENLRLSLLTDKKNAPLLAKLTDDYFTQYFATSISSGTSLNLPVDGIFLPFKNCIRYGLYLPQATINKEGSLAISFSQIFLDALKNEAVDDETILTFAFYLQIGLIYSISNIHPQFKKELKPTLKSQFNGDLDKDIFRSKFEDNKMCFLEIINDINNSSIDLPEWVTAWLKLCEIEVLKADVDIPLLHTYRSIIKLVYNQLSIKNNMSNILSYWIEQALFDDAN